jgi:hypothetical protein
MHYRTKTKKGEGLYRYMRSFLTAALCACALGVALSARADLAVTYIPGLGNDVSKKDVGASPAQVFAWLSGLPGLPGPAPSNSNVQNFEGLNGSSISIPINGSAYLVLHYGVGNGGVQGTGGGILAAFATGTGNFVVPANGSGQNGFGGISFVRVFNGPSSVPGVPDSGKTLPLLAMGLVGLIGLSRLQIKRATS